MRMQLPLIETEVEQFYEIYWEINFVSVTSIKNLNEKVANILSSFWIFFFFFDYSVIQWM